MYSLRACLHEGGGLHVGEVTCGKLPYLTCKRDHIKMRVYMDRRVTPPKRVTSPMWGIPSPCKQALNRLKVLEKNSFDSSQYKKVCSIESGLRQNGHLSLKADYSVSAHFIFSPYGYLGRQYSMLI